VGATVESLSHDLPTQLAHLVNDLKFTALQ
jgi:hypothetical protein